MVAIDINRDALRDLCQRWLVVELALFGSALREGFSVTSDVDLLVTFAERAAWSLWDVTAMRDELAAIFGRPVDLVEKRAIRNPFRRRAILAHNDVLYAAG